MKAAYCKCVSNTKIYTYIYMTTNQSSDTEIIDFQSIIISAIILQFSSTKDVHHLLNAKLCPIYSPINKSSRLFINIS